MTLQVIHDEVINCRRCPRLVTWREKVAHEKRKAFRGMEYWGKPVPGFGDEKASVFVVGLAPGAHGSNRTGRQFTGDASGDFLYPALFRAGFASQSDSRSRTDGLVLHDLYTAPVCRCAPPDNKPSREEMDNCEHFLVSELEIINPRILVALGRIAFDRILRVINHGKIPAGGFGHLAQYTLESGVKLICSYHPSRQNTQTGRLTVEMFDRVWKTVKDMLD